VLCGAAVVALAPAAAFAHGGAEPKPSATTIFTAWELDPLFIVPAALALWAYVAGVRKVNREHPGNPAPRSRLVYFLLGMAALVLAIISPIAAYDTDLFAVHMVQHLLIIMVAVPLVLLGAPITLLLRASSPRVRRTFVLPVLHSRALKAVSQPVFAWVFLTVVLWLSHFSPLFDGALENPWAHRGEHLLYLAAAALFWWPVVAVDPAPWRLKHPVRMLYVFLQMPQQSFLSVAIYNSSTVIFPHYETVARTWGPGPLTDQQLAGTIMWVFGDLMYLAVLGMIAYGWMQAENRAAIRADRSRARERARAALES
jgi:putative copper resistance protein D